MMASKEESTTFTEPTEKRKKKKQKLDKPEKNTVEESQCHHNKNTKKKKKPKKKASVSEVPFDIMNVAPKKKKKNNKALDMALRDPETNGDIPKEKTTLDKDMSSGDPTSTKGTRKKKKKKKVVDNETSTRDPQTTDDVPKKKKKKNVAEEIVTKKKKKMIPKDNGVTLPTTNASVPKSKAVSERKSITVEVPEDDISEKKKGTKKVLSSSHIPEDKDVTADQRTHGLDCPYSDGMSGSKLKKCKKSKRPKTNCEDKAPDTGNVLTDVTVIQKKRKVSKPEEELGSPIEDQPKMSDHAKVKKKKPTSKQTEVIEDHDVQQGEAGGDSLRVSKKKKISKGSLIEESGLKEADLNGNRVKDIDITEGALKKKKKGNKAKEASELVDATDESLHVTCHKEEKKKSKKKRKKEEMLKQADKEHSANVDTSEVPKKKKKSTEETKNSKEERKKQGENSDVQLVSAQEGSTDEVHIDTVKRKALQEDIDRESGISKGTKFGQWDTATFQNSDQQTKFFRLLGGFKKGNQASLTSPSKQVKANMALGKEGGQVLERNLLEEFDKAVSWKKNRGTGLGFQPAQSKTFYIDKTASKSIKFED